MIKQRTRRLISTWYGTGELGSCRQGSSPLQMGCGRGSRLLQLNLLRENLTTAELWHVHLVEGVLLQLYLYSNALACPEGGKCHLFFHILTGWSAYMGESSSCWGVSGSQLLAAGLLAPRSSLPRCSRLAPATVPQLSMSAGLQALD